MNNSAPGIFKVYAAEKGGRSGCVGYVKNRKYCNEKIEILDHKVLDFHAGSPHRCREMA